LLRGLFTGAVLAYGAVSLNLGGTVLARPTFLGLAGAWACFLFLAPERLCRLLRPRPLRWLDLLGFNLALTAGLAEGSLRLLAARSGASWIVSDALDGYRLHPGREYGEGLRGNQLGFPGPELRSEKRPGVFRIAALGDSFAVGPTVPFADNFLTLLGKAHAPWEVYNFGISGTGPREYRLILNRHVWEFQPDLVLVCVFVGNDITETLATPRHLDPRQSCLYLLLSRAGKVLRERWRTADQATAEEGPRRGEALSTETFGAVEARRLAVCARQPGAGLEKKWRQALAHLDGITTDCRRHKVPLAVVLIPDELQVNPLVLRAALQDSGFAEADLDLALPQRRLAAFFAKRSVPCLDLLPVFRNHADTYTPRDTHWNARGNRLAAEHLRPWLQSLTVRCPG
jgi:hypothetical protein